MLGNGDLYVLNNRIAEKLFEKVVGKIGKILIPNKNRNYLFFMANKRVYVIDMVKDLIEDLVPKKAFSLSSEDHGKIRDIEFDF